jgi:hypothetical protein
MDPSRDEGSVNKGEAARLGYLRIANEQVFEAHFQSSSSAIDDEMLADSMGLFFLTSC